MKKTFAVVMLLWTEEIFHLHENCKQSLEGVFCGES